MSILLNQNPTLKELFEKRVATSQSGETVEVEADIRPAFAEALYSAVLKAKPQLVVEIGMAFGGSSLAILTALNQIGENGKLISIDPNQSTQWRNCGVVAVKKAGFENSHELIEKFDYIALPELLSRGDTIDFAYIDGWHTFDYTLIDFWFIDKMLKAEGVVGFNDCHLTAVDRVIKFVLSHRKYEEINVGLPIEYSDYTPLREIKRVAGAGGSRPNYYKQAQDRYLRKMEVWEPDWDFYAEF
ncbi:MAG TPA: class I SAM-dependent methyltransferase [Pyrinomonadaceae bacterium]|nr:class I SAM-dependent methyltransferase [Pyrinomonadaceae bacterium]